MLPEIVNAILVQLQQQKLSADISKDLAIGSDKRYYAGMSAAYGLAINLLFKGPGRVS